MAEARIYDRVFVESLFNGMSTSYWSSGLLSFGILNLLRQRAVKLLDLTDGMTVYDFMCGTGECWKAILRSIGAHGRLIAIDFSPHMVTIARRRVETRENHSVSVVCHDVLDYQFRSQADAVLCAFGVKTLAERDLSTFARQVRRALKPDGKFVLVELRNPSSAILRHMCRLYVGSVVPRLLRWCGYPWDGYLRLSEYLASHRDEETLLRVLKNNGFEATYHHALWGLGVVYRCGAVRGATERGEL